jgi:hypothetical protein
VLFVEGNTDKVGILNSNPQKPLEITSNDFQLRLSTASGTSNYFTQFISAYDSTNPFRIQGYYNGTQVEPFKIQAAGGFGSPVLRLGQDMSYISLMQGTIERAVLSPTEYTHNEHSHDHDFRVESDSNTHMLFVDAGNNRVGVGMSTPLEPLHTTGRILSTTTYGSSTQRIGTSIGQNGSTRADIDFRRWTGASTNHGVGMIEVADTGIMRFYVDSKTSNTPATTERISLAPSGAFTTTPTTAGHAVFNEGGVDADFRVESNNNTHMLFVDAGNDLVTVGASGGYGTLQVSGPVNTEYRTLFVTHENDATQGVGIAFDNTNAKGVIVSVDAGTGWNDVHMQPSGGNVAIGHATSTAATAKLDVNGGVKVGGLLNVEDIIAKNSGGLNLQTDEGTKRLIVDDSGNIVLNETGTDSDFRVESDSNANMLFVDGGNNRIGVGNSSPTATYTQGTSNQSTDIAATVIFSARSGEMTQKQVFNGATASSETIDLLTISSYQSTNTNVFIVVEYLLTSPISPFGQKASAHAFIDNGGSSSVGTFTAEHSAGSPPSVPTLSWSSNTLRMVTPAAAYAYYAVNVSYVAYDGATIAFDTAKYNGS